MERENMNNSNSGTAGNQAVADTKQELKQRIAETVDKIVKQTKWNCVIGLALIVVVLWQSLSCSVERFMGYKLIHVAVFGLLLEIISAVDMVKINKLKRFTSRQELLGGVAYLKKSESLTKWLLIVFLFLYILLDVLSDWSVGMVVIGSILFLIFFLVYLSTFDSIPSHKRIKELEDDLSQLSEMEKE